MLTSADVEQKTFSTALRGYDLDEVDDFLDEVVVTLRALNDQLEEARSTAEAPAVTPGLAPEPAPVAEPEPEPALEAEPEAEPVAEAPVREIDESAIGRALIAAQTAADRLLDDARSEADKMVEEAKSAADSWSAEREAKRREAEAEIARLTDRVASVRSELSVLAGEVADKLDEMDAVIHAAAEDEVGPVDDDFAAGTEVGAVVEGGDEGEPVRDEWGHTGEEPAHGQEPDAPFGSGDHLDAMLSGVVNDLQLPSEEPEGQDDDDEYSEDSDGDDNDKHSEGSDRDDEHNERPNY